MADKEEQGVGQMFFMCIGGLQWISMAFMASKVADCAPKRGLFVQAFMVTRYRL